MSTLKVDTIQAYTGGATLTVTPPLTVTGLITANGGVTGNVTGNCTGSSGSCTGNAATSTTCNGNAVSATNATTATTLQTARTINTVSFNGSADITVTADASTLTNTTLNSTVLDSSLTSLGTIASLTATVFKLIPTAAVPTATGQSGVVGTITWDSSYLYICVGATSWKRVALATW